LQGVPSSVVRDSDPGAVQGIEDDRCGVERSALRAAACGTTLRVLAQAGLQEGQNLVERLAQRAAGTATRGGTRDGAAVGIAVRMTVVMMAPTPSDRLRKILQVGKLPALRCAGEVGGELRQLARRARITLRLRGLRRGLQVGGDLLRHLRVLRRIRLL